MRRGSRGRPSRRPQRTRAKEPAPSLTPRQREILALVLEGLTNREIAEHLGISRRTVEVHRFNLMRRLGVRNIAQLYRVALLNRLIPQQQ